MKALALFSGGLDSTLAAAVVRRQGIAVVGVHFRIPFCSSKVNSGQFLQGLADRVGMELREETVGEEFFALIKSPRHGFGANLNPCIDCRILMLARARVLMDAVQASFLVSGEVVGQRPMSQGRDRLALIDREAGVEGLVVRPLSGRLLPPTIAEEKGWIAREGLLDFNGRNRRPQMDLAERLGITGYARPAGGCLLTEPLFVNKIKDLRSHGSLTLDNVELLKVGRHFRLSPEAKLVVGRDARENARLVSLAGQDDYLFMPSETVAGATCLGRGSFTDELFRLAASINARYCDLPLGAQTEVFYHRAGQPQCCLTVSPAPQETIEALRL